MNNALLSIRTDDKTKREITKFADSIGLSVSAFVTVVLKQAVREGQLTLTPVLEPTPYLEKIMREADEDLKHNQNITHTNSKEEAIAHLKSLM